MRTATTAQASALESKYFKLALKVEIADADATLQDWSSYLSSLSLDYDIDQMVGQCNVALRRDSASTESLSPLRTDSTLNRNALGAYAPAITAGRLIVVSIATVSPSASIASSDYVELLRGVIDRTTFAATAISLTARDLAGALVDAWVTAEATLGSNDGDTSLEEVIQFLLDTYTDTDFTLAEAEATGEAVTKYTQSVQTVADAITALRQIIGYDARMKYSDDDTEWQFTLIDPDRDKTTADLTIAKSRIIEVRDLNIDRTTVRNAIDGWYTDSTTRLVTNLNVGDTISQAAYGFLWAGFREASDSPINTETKMFALLNAALADLKDPKAEQEIEMHVDWRIELNDLIKFTANGIHYDDDMTGAVVALQHRFAVSSDGTIQARTVVKTRGAPCSGYLTWRDRQYTPLPPSVIPEPPILSERINRATGVIDVLFDGYDTATETRCAIRTDRAPTLEEALDGVSGGVGVRTGACLSVATLTPGAKFFVAGVSLNAQGNQSALTKFASAFLGVDATPLPTASFGTGVVQANQITWPVTFGATTQRIYFFVEYDTDDPDDSTTSGKDVESSVSGVFTYFDRNESAVVDGVVLLKVPLRKSDHWVTVTAVPIDALNVRGPKANIKLQGPSSPPSAPNAPTITAGTATSNTLPVTVTFPSSGTAAAKIRPYLDGEPLADVAITTWSHSGTQAYTFSGATIVPGSSHTLRVSLVTSDGVEGAVSSAVPMTCAGDTSGGDEGTGDNGKLATPLAGSASWSRSAQQALIVFAENYDDGMFVSVWSCATSGGVYTRTSAVAPADGSPVAVDAPITGTEYTTYYRLTAYDPTGVYSESDKSTAVSVTVPVR